jgi:hypothetical protein
MMDDPDTRVYLAHLQPRALREAASAASRPKPRTNRGNRTLRPDCRRESGRSRRVGRSQVQHALLSRVNCAGALGILFARWGRPGNNLRWPRLSPTFVDEGVIGACARGLAASDRRWATVGPPSRVLRVLAEAKARRVPRAHYNLFPCWSSSAVYLALVSLPFLFGRANCGKRQAGGSALFLPFFCAAAAAEPQPHLIVRISNT